MQEQQQNRWLIPAIAIVIGLMAGYWYGAGVGYKKAALDIKTAQEEAITKAAAEAAKGTNPFETVNPMEGVNSNPFQQTQKTLNPFE